MNRFLIKRPKKIIKKKKEKKKSNYDQTFDCS